MTLSRSRRVVTGVAAGVIVLLAALIGASFRDDSSGVSIASELRPANIIAIEEDPVEEDAVEEDPVEDDQAPDAALETTEDAAEADAPDANDAADTDASDDSTDDQTDAAATPDANESADTGSADDTANETDADEPLTDPVQVIETDDDTEATGAADDAADATTETDTTETDTPPADTAPTDAAPAAPVAPPEAPLTAADGSLGTGGGVNDAECALDRLVIYAGARRGGVAGSIRAALAQAGFGAGCSAPVTVLASNCPLQFSGALGAGSGYDPNRSFVASSSNVDRATLTAVMSTVGYSGNQIDILDFGFVNADQPGEQWIAIFIPPSFDGWQNLAARAGLSPTASSLCAPSGRLAG